MTKPVSVPCPGVIVPADVASVIAPTLERALARERSIGSRVHPDVAETVERIALLADVFRNQRDVDKRHGPVPRAAPPRADVGTSISVKDATALLGIKERGVRALCLRGTLHADKQDDGSWSICAESVTARLENAKCQH